MKKLFIFCFLFAIINLFLQTSLVAQPYTGYEGSVMLKNSKWPSKSNGETVIEVSWENPTSSNLQGRKWVQEAIEETWEKEANIDFVGWGKSTSTSKGIRIVVDDMGWPHCKGLGTNIDGKEDGMLLNFEFKGTFTCTGYTKENCIKFVAVHEFGHALGLSHEHNRADCLCEIEPQGTVGDFNLTDCDPNSIMNYCNDDWNNNGELSDLDIVGITKVYGKKGSTTKSIELEEIRMIPCGNGKVAVLNNIKKAIKDDKTFYVTAYSEETNTVPQKAVDNLTASSITIRYFHPDDADKADKLKEFLKVEGYTSVDIQNMLPKMSKTYPNYLEIWYKGTN